MLLPKPLILFIDAYDSFSNNIVSLLETTLDVSVRTIKIDNPTLATDDALHQELRHYIAVVCGPGPGHPANEQDVGLMRRIWRLNAKHMLPVLGICLGFQSLCLEFGADVKRLKGPQHGIIRRISHIGDREVNGGETIFHTAGDITATLYQSLCVDIGQDVIAKDQWQMEKWKPSQWCPELQPLAWVEHDISVANDAGVEDDRVLVAVQHISKPFWALQYHPESICTNGESQKVLQQWFEYVATWNKQNRQRRLSFQGPIEGKLAVRESLLKRSEKRKGSKGQHQTTMISGLQTEPDFCHSLVMPIPANVSVAEIVEAMQVEMNDCIVLESSNAHEKSVRGADVRGRFSIIALDVEKASHYMYSARSNRLHFFYESPKGRICKAVDLRVYGGIWQFLAKHLEERPVKDVCPRNMFENMSPFWGGFMGYTSYELGLSTIGVHSEEGNSRHSDLCFAWITRSLVIDHVENVIYIQELAPLTSFVKTSSWQLGIRKTLEDLLFPTDCFSPCTATYVHLPEDTTKERLLQMMAKQGITQSPYIKLHYSGSSFTGIATVLYENDIGSVEKIFFANGNCIRMRNMSRQFPPATTNQPSPATPVNLPSSVVSIQAPQDSEYEDKVFQCQEKIRSGDSYELCLTDQTHITLRKPSSSDPSSSNSNAWSIYRTLCKTQPAPFASFIRLGSATFISASPERFLTYTQTGLCELRPMKGTVRKSPQVSTLAKATALLDIPKEKAENLMIVDLVRHDLHGICGAGNVSVPRLMVVEEYKSVFQMISVVKGQLPSLPSIPSSSNSHIKEFMSEDEIEKKRRERYTGLDILAASLPPGSMTGAPKKRSCEILQTIENGRPRSLYSGVVGYMDVRGRGDWSVNIRCLYKWDDEDSDHPRYDEDGEVVGVDVDKSRKGKEKEGESTEVWHVGAGGAVTALSTAVGEREEMLTKLSGTLGLFRSASLLPS